MALRKYMYMYMYHYIKHNILSVEEDRHGVIVGIQSIMK